MQRVSLSRHHSLTHAVKLVIEVRDYFWYVTVTSLHAFTTRAIANTSSYTVLSLDINVVLFLLVGRSADQAVAVGRMGRMTFNWPPLPLHRSIASNNVSRCHSVQRFAVMRDNCSCPTSFKRPLLSVDMTVCWPLCLKLANISETKQFRGSCQIGTV